MPLHHSWTAPVDATVDPLVHYDAQRRRCPVARDDALQYSVFRHADALRLLLDHDTFSNQASRHRSVPNSMDPPEHGAYRRLIEPYFSAGRLAQFLPACRRISAQCIAALPQDGVADLMSALAHPFALRMQCAFMGWPDSLHEPLRQWVRRKNEATRSGDPQATAQVAQEFEELLARVLADFRRADPPGQDITSRLLRETINGTPLPESEITSILRNWTVGELGTIAASVGIIAHYLAAHPDLQEHLRRHPGDVRRANDEILRIRAPLVANRRKTTREVDVSGTRVPAGARLTLLWASANRDEAVFGDPDEFRLDRDPALNLLYGAGIHACPGAGLARMELESIIQALLAATDSFLPEPGHRPRYATYPEGGFETVPLRLQRTPSP